MSLEGQLLDHKSIRVLRNGHRELAKDCVAFANAQGGTIKIGIEDGEIAPRAGQKIDSIACEDLRKKISQVTANVSLDIRVVVAPNGGEYVELKVFPSRRSLAATTDGRYFIRISDECRPLMPEDLFRVMAEKSAYDWELDTSLEVTVLETDVEKQRTLLQRVRGTGRVSGFLNEKSDTELLDYFMLSRGGQLTNLGVLWIGRREHRAQLRHAPTIQCIKFDEVGKINKWRWSSFDLNPMELIEAVWKEVPDWLDSQEFPDGLFRTHVPHYDEIVVRELLANALAHRPYTQAGDIFINLYPDRLEVHNPGLLPLGVTPHNILHSTVKRNEHLANLFYALGLMEQEGSGIDRIYEVLLGSGKRLPEVREDGDRVTVTVYKRVLNPAVLDFTSKAYQSFNLTQRERISLGLIAQHESLTAIELSRLLDLNQPEDLRHWMGRLVDWNLVRKRGRTRGLSYSVEPLVLKDLDYRGTTSLKGIEDHRLRELVLQDLRIYHPASSREIQCRIGPEIPIRRLRAQLERLISEGLIEKIGAKRSSKYAIRGPQEAP